MRHTIRPITFNITQEKLMEIHNTQKFQDMVAVGKLLNAIRYANDNGVQFELAKFAYSRTATVETIYMTGGLLYRALTLSELLLIRYEDKPCVFEFKHLVNGILHYMPPGLLFEMVSNGPFRMGTKPGASHLLRELDINGKHQLFRQLQLGERGVAVAFIADPNELWDGYKRGGDVEAYETMGCVIDALVDEFTVAAEEFIFSIAKELGLTNAAEPPAEEMKLAA